MTNFHASALDENIEMAGESCARQILLRSGSGKESDGKVITSDGWTIATGKSDGIEVEQIESIEEAVIENIVAELPAEAQTYEMVKHILDGAKNLLEEKRIKL